MNPATVTTALPEAVEVWTERGLACPLATAPVTLTNPRVPEVEPLDVGCAVAGVPRVKIGFFPFTPGEDYRALVHAARRALKGFAGE